MIHNLIYEHLAVWHCGKGNAIHMAELAERFGESDRAIRQIIFDINHNKVRCNGTIGNNKIIGDNSGYYMVANKEELRALRNKVIHRIKREVALLKMIDGDNKEGQLTFDFDDDELKIIKELKEDMQLLTITEIGNKLGVSREHVYNLLAQGMPYITVGKRKRFDEKEVMAWLKKNQDKK